MIDIVSLAQVVLNGILTGGMYALFVSGFTLTYAVSRFLNFAHGHLMTLALYGCIVLFDLSGWDPYMSMIIIVPIMFALGLLLFRYVLLPVLESYFLLSVQLALGVLFTIEGTLLLVFKSDVRTLISVLGPIVLRADPLSIWLPNLAGFLASMAVLATLYWVLMRTDLGRSIRAFMQNPLAAKLMGIRVNRLRTIAFGVAIGITAMAGCLLAPSLVITPVAGLHLTMLSLIIMMMGGLGNFAGTLVASLIVGMAQSLGAYFLGGTLSMAIPYGIFVIILLFKPQGLLGKV